MKRTGLKKGSKITAEPIRKKKDITAISRLLKSRPRDFLLWTLGINNGLRSSDIVRLRYSQVEGLKPGAVIKITESKTGKDNVLVINNSVFKALQNYIQEVKPSPDDYLFSSRKGKGHISSQSVGRMVRSWAEAINLKGQYGAHTLRKTFGYCQRMNFGEIGRASCREIV